MDGKRRNSNLLYVDHLKREYFQNVPKAKNLLGVPTGLCRLVEIQQRSVGLFVSEHHVRRVPVKAVFYLHLTGNVLPLINAQADQVLTHARMTLQAYNVCVCYIHVQKTNVK